MNWFLIAALVTWSLAAGYFPQEYPGWSARAYWTAGALTALLFFGSVLVHELGHAVIARREGVPVNSITLFIFGGIAHIEHEPETAGAEFRIVIAGPLASFSLGVAFNLLGRLLAFSPAGSGAAFYLSQVNFILAAFNLLPGFPLDGGRVLRSLFWRLKNDFVQATRWATNAGLGMALVLILSGLLLMVGGQYFNGLWVAFIGWYLSTASRSSYRETMLEEAVQIQAARGQRRFIIQPPAWMPIEAVEPPPEPPLTRRRSVSLASGLAEALHPQDPPA